MRIAVRHLTVTGLSCGFLLLFTQASGLQGPGILAQRLQKALDDGMRWQPGVGIQHFLPNWIPGMKVYGHSGGSIGTVAYMLYLPEYGVSIAAMMNSFEGKSLSVKSLARVAVNYLHDPSPLKKSPLIR
jgi:hypothetical protein